MCQRDNPAFPDAAIERFATGTNNRERLDRYFGSEPEVLVLI
jgi:hypothetical protein